jgi:preprotein translocase subunit SecE
METKKNHPQIDTSSRKEVKAAANWNVYEWLSQIKQEFFKISWTNSEELKVYTQIVVGATFIFGLGIYGIDLGIHAVLNGLSSIIYLLGG